MEIYSGSTLQKESPPVALLGHAARLWVINILTSLCIAIFMLAALVLSSCDRGITAHGRVKDFADAPIAGAMITVDFVDPDLYDCCEVSETNGEYEIKIMCSGPRRPGYRLLAEKAGFKPIMIERTGFRKMFGYGHEGHLDFTLAPENCTSASLAKRLKD